MDLVLAEFFAAAFDIAVFAAWTTAYAVGYLASFLWDTMGLGEVAFADAAVHAAWRYEFRLEMCLLHKRMYDVGFI